MSAISNLCASIVAHFKNQGIWKKALGGSTFALIKHKDLDLYIFVGVYNEKMAGKWRIALAAKEPETIEKIAQNRDELEDNCGFKLDSFKLRGTRSAKNKAELTPEVTKYQKGIFDWQEDYIAIHHKWYNGDLQSELFNMSEDYVKGKVIKKYDEEWTDLTDNILNLI